MDLPYLHGAGKPSRRKLRQALAAMELPPDRVGMVGDRLFTDVVAGNRLGMYTILVEPILDPTAKSVKTPVRAIEVWFSRLVGASLATSDAVETHR
jgi:HAD superfamily phosphatase (TIGR01668 family)